MMQSDRLSSSQRKKLEAELSVRHIRLELLDEVDDYVDGGAESRLFLGGEGVIASEIEADDDDNEK